MQYLKENKKNELNTAIFELDNKFHKPCKNGKVGCTIIIPTRNRPGLYNRLMNYYNERGIDNPIIVADSTGYSKMNKYENLNDIKTISYKPETSMFDKLADIGQYVKTKYCVVSADDDFLIPQSIEKCKGFLELNPNFVMATGQFYGIPDNSKPYVEPGSPIFPVIAPSGNKRFLIHFSNYMVTAYGVYRTEVFNHVWDETLKYRHEDVWAELFASALTATMGNIMVFPHPHTVRSLQDDSDGQSAKGLYGYVANGSYKWRYANFRNGLINNGLDGNVIDKGWKKYTKHYHWFLKDRLAYLIRVCCFKEMDREKVI